VNAAIVTWRRRRMKRLFARLNARSAGRAPRLSCMASVRTVVASWSLVHEGLPKNWLDIRLRPSVCSSQRGVQVLSNRLFDTDTHWHCAAQRVGEPTPCGAVPVRAGQRQR